MFFIYSILMLATLVGSNGIADGRGANIALGCIYTALAALIVAILVIAPGLKDVSPGAFANLQAFGWYAAIVVSIAFLHWLRRVLLKI